MNEKTTTQIQLESLDKKKYAPPPKKKEMAASPPEQKKLFAYAFNRGWTSEEAKSLFTKSNWVRYIAIAVLIYHAIKALQKNEKQVEVTAFAVLQLCDILMRLPLAIATKPQYVAVRNFSAIYVVLITIYLVPLVGKPIAMTIFVIMAVIYFLIFRQARKIGETGVF